MLRLNFHHLFYFHTIAGEGQVARAARRLRIGQPALSTQLKQFEEFLGYRLFDRKRGQALALTPHGKLLFDYSKEIFRLSDEMLGSLRGLRESSRLHLTLGALDWLPKKEVNDLIVAVTRKFDCFVSVHEDTATNLLAKLGSQEIDLAVTNAPAAGEAPLRSHRVARLPVMICGAPKYAHLKKGFPRSLEGQPLILPTRHGNTRHAVEDFLESAEIRARIVGEAQDGELLRHAALSGTALVPLSPSTVARELARKELVKLGVLSGVFEEVWLVSARRLVSHPVVDHLMKLSI